MCLEAQGARSTKKLRSINMEKDPSFEINFVNFNQVVMAVDYTALNVLKNALNSANYCLY